MESKLLGEVLETVEKKPELASNGGLLLGEVEKTVPEKPVEPLEPAVPIGWYGTAVGKITHIRCNDIGHTWGGGNDKLNTEVIVRISSAPGYAFGFELRPGDKNLPSNLAMLSLLRDAFVHNIKVVISYHSNGNKNCKMRRVDIYK